MRLTAAVDDSVLGQYLTQHVGQKVTLNTLRMMVAKAFGQHNYGKVYLGCKNGILVDIYIQLPALIPFEQTLEALIDDATNPDSNDSCPKNVMLSSFNKAAWSYLYVKSTCTGIRVNIELIVARVQQSETRGSEPNQ
ncbi:MAG: hypothetical protein ACRCXC_11625 [Legionella sp.]